MICRRPSVGFLCCLLSLLLLSIFMPNSKHWVTTSRLQGGRYRKGNRCSEFVFMQQCCCCCCCLLLRVYVCVRACVRVRASVLSSSGRIRAGSLSLPVNSEKRSAPNSKHWLTTSFLWRRCRKTVLGVWVGT